MKSLLHFLLLILFQTTISAQQVDMLQYNECLALKNRGDYTDAILCFTDFLENNNYPKAYLHRGYSNLYSKNEKNAIADFNQLISLDAKEAEAPFALGRIYFQKGATDLAFQSFTQAIQVDPYYAAAYNDRGLVQCYTANFDQAQEDFQKAISLDPSFAMAYNNAGAARYYNQDIAKPHKKDIRQAKELFTKAIEQEPTLALAFRNRGAMSIFLKEYELSKSDLEKSHQLNPNDALTLFYLGVVHADEGNGKIATNYFNKSITEDSKLPFNYEELGNMQKRLKRYDAAMDNYRKAAQLNAGALYTGLIDYRIALLCAETDAKDRMYQHLKKAKKAQVFNDQQVYRDFLKATELDRYRTEKKFKRFQKKLSKLKKTNKFLNPQLGWFRMS